MTIALGFKSDSLLSLWPLKYSRAHKVIILLYSNQYYLKPELLLGEWVGWNSTQAAFQNIKKLLLRECLLCLLLSFATLSVTQLHKYCCCCAYVSNENQNLPAKMLKDQLSSSKEYRSCYLSPDPCSINEVCTWDLKLVPNWDLNFQDISSSDLFSTQNNMDTLMTSLHVRSHWNVRQELASVCSQWTGSLPGQQLSRQDRGFGGWLRQNGKQNNLWMSIPYWGILLRVWMPGCCRSIWTNYALDGGKIINNRISGNSCSYLFRVRGSFIL